jgi:hypothetical protein
MFGLPLKVFNKESKLFPLFTLHDFDIIENTKSFLIGTTNQIVMNHSKVKFDAIVNIDTQKIQFFNMEGNAERIFKISKDEKNLFNSIFNKLKSNFVEKDENWMINLNSYEPTFEGSDDYIRNEFKNYFYNLLINTSLAIQIINNENEENELHLSILNDNRNSGDSKDKEDTSDDEYDDFDKDKLKKIQKMRKERMKQLKKAVKKVLGSFKMKLISQWIQTLNFKFWFNQHNKNLCLRSSYVKEASNLTIIYENGDVFTGSISRGKKHGFGVFSEISTGNVYNGNWLEDAVNYYFIFRKMEVDL